MQMYSYELEGLAQANSVLTSSNSAVMAQLAQMNVTMNDMQAQLKILSLAPNNQTRSKRKYYCFSCRSNYTHGSKTWAANKAGRQEDAYYKTRLVGSEKGYEWRLGAIINKI